MEGANRSMGHKGNQYGYRHKGEQYAIEVSLEAQIVFMIVSAH
jgi:hypothetical protein